jgi:hypothetical protein
LRAWVCIAKKVRVACGYWSGQSLNQAGQFQSPGELELPSIIETKWSAGGALGFDAKRIR